MDAASMTIDELVSWEKEEARSPYLRTPLLNLEEKNYKDMYFSGCFDVGGSGTRCDWIDERVGYNDYSLSDISKVEFSKEALLNDSGSSLATSLSFVLKRKGGSGVKFTRKRAILKRSKMVSLRKGVRSHNIKAGVAKINAEVDSRSVTSYRMIAKVPTLYLGKLVGFSNAKEPIIKLDNSGYQTDYSLLKFNPIHGEFQILGIKGNGDSFCIGPYKESLLLLTHIADHSLLILFP
nr:hypothetical protein [Tanacetum cinerariifolium]